MNRQYEIATSEVIHALWDVSRSTTPHHPGEALAVGGLQIGSVPPGLVRFESRVRAFELIGRNTHQWDQPARRHFAFPNFHQSGAEGGIQYGCVFVPMDWCEKRKVASAELGSPSGTEASFRAVNDYASRQPGFRSGIPTFHDAGGCRSVVLFRQSVVEYLTVAADKLGSPSTPEAKFRAANDYAISQGYSAGYPNFHQKMEGGVLEYGIWVFHPGIAKIVAVHFTVATVLGSPTNFDALLPAVPIGQLQVGDFGIGEADGMPAFPLPEASIRVPEPC